MTWPRTTTLALGMVLALALLAAGCASSGSDSASTDGTDATSATASGATDSGATDAGSTTTQALDLGDERLEITIPEGWSTKGASGSRSTEGCSTTGYKLGPDGDPIGLEIDLVSSGCDEQGQRIGNGDHGTYVDVNQVGSPGSPEDIDTPVGPAVGFTQSYQECTNDCQTWDEPVVLVHLSRPVDPDKATVMLYSPKAEIDHDQLTEIAKTLQPSG